MNIQSRRNPRVLRWIVAAAFVIAAQAQADDAIDMGSNVPDAKSVKEGLFPDDSCRDLQKAGFKCMGFKPAVRYSLPAATFKVGSAELPELLREQLDVFAAVLREKKGSDQTVLIEGHADASGTPAINDALSQQRADAVKNYLVAKGADAAMLDAVGVGAKEPKDAAHPYAPENRRVEIGRKNGSGGH